MRSHGFLGVAVSVIVLQPVQIDWLTKHIFADDFRKEDGFDFF